MRRLVPCLSSLILLGACHSPGVPAVGPSPAGEPTPAPAAIAPTPSPSPQKGPSPVGVGVDMPPPKVFEVDTTPHAPLRFHAGVLTPETVTLKLVAPPGAAGTVVRSINVTYRYDTPTGGPTETAPFNSPIDALAIPGASDIAPGPETSLRVAIGTEALARIAQAHPKQVTATIELIDEQGFVVLDKNFTNLQVAIAIVMD